VYPVTTEALKERTEEYRNWVNAYARKPSATALDAHENAFRAATHSVRSACTSQQRSTLPPHVRSPRCVSGSPCSGVAMKFLMTSNALAVSHWSAFLRPPVQENSNLVHPIPSTTSISLRDKVKLLEPSPS
jgi:hypothetical protein